jgi:tyrosine-protein phosphatase YwqE
LVDFVNEFIEYSNLNGSYFVYFNITNETKLSTIIENNQSEIINKKVFLLPDKNIKYSKLSIDFWDMNLLGYEIYLLKCDGMKECQKNPNIINKLLQKGAIIGITGSKKHSFGILHKRIINQLVKEKLVNFWITETIFEKDYNYSKELKMKLEFI